MLQSRQYEKHKMHKIARFFTVFIVHTITRILKTSNGVLDDGEQPLDVRVVPFELAVIAVPVPARTGLQCEK